MPSPFPGMDPFIEGRLWADFHLRLIAVISDFLVPQIRPRYVVRAEERIYLEHETDDRVHIRPDLTIVDDGSVLLRQSGGMGGGVATAVPQSVTLPMPEEIIERYLTIRDRETLDVVTVIEVQSPSNKRAGSTGRAEYLQKRDEVLRSGTHLVEIDLLRGGERSPTYEKLEPADYYVFVSRKQTRPRAQAYHFMLQEPLPTIPIPLAIGDPDVPLNLQTALTTAYDRAGYDYSLDYAGSLEPPGSESDSRWVQGILRNSGVSTI